MRIVWGTSRDPELNHLLATWAAQRIWGDDRGFDNCKTMGVLKDDALIAVAVFHNWDPSARIIEISGASDSKLWLTRPVLKAMFGYAFNDLGCQMVVQRVSERNKPIQRILKAYGYDLHLVPRLRGPDEGEYICCLTVEAWRENKFNRKSLPVSLGVEETALVA